MVLGQDLGVLCEQPLLLHLDHVGLVLFLSVLDLAFLQFDSALLSVHRELLLPQTFDLALVLLLAHPALLLVHLLQTLVLSELMQQLLFEVFFQTAFLSGSLGLQSHLEVLRFLKLPTGLVLLVLGLLLPKPGRQLILLNVKLVAKVFLKFLLGTTSHLLSLESLKDKVPSLLSRVLSLLDLVKALLLLLGVLSNHFVLKAFHLFLPPHKGPLLIHGQDHVRLCLLHLQVLDAGHFTVFTDHALDDRIDLVFLFKVLLLSFGLQLLTVNDLALDGLFVSETVVFPCFFSLSVDLVLDLFGSKHDFVDLSVLLLSAREVR